jgi:hypothetical protein
MYVGIGIVLVAIGLIALAVVNVNPWIGALLILLGLAAVIAAFLLPNPLRRPSRHDYPPLG